MKKKEQVINFSSKKKGDGGTGKTCMLITYAHSKFPVDYIPTVFDNYVVDLNVNNELLEMGLWDTVKKKKKITKKK